MSRQRGVVIEAPNAPLVVRDDLPIPEPAADELLVKLLFSGICSTDLHIWEKIPDFQLNYPIIAGHEGVGEVAKIGAGVTGKWQVGDRVGIQCEFCLRGFDCSCPNRRCTGFDCDGTFQQYALVSAICAVPLPSGIDLAQAAPILCAGTTVYRGLMDGNLRPGQFVAVPGAGGGLGTLAVQYARALSYRVIGIDTKAKRDRVLEFGAEAFVAIDEVADVAAAVMSLTDGGAHLVINVANPLAATQQSLGYCRERGTILFIAMDDGELRVPLFDTARRAITLKGTLIGNRQDAIEALSFLQRGLVKTFVEIVSLNDVQRTLERLHNGDVTGRVVIDLWRD